MKIRFSTVFLSLLIAMMLSILPLPTVVAMMRPPWVLLVLLYWMSSKNGLFGLFSIWVCGVFLDVLTASTMGEHALSLIVSCYLGQNYLRRLKFYPLWQQSLLIALFVLVYQLIIVCVEFMTGYSISILLIIAPVVISMLFWPWVVLLLDEYGGQNKIQTH